MFTFRQTCTAFALILIATSISSAAPRGINGQIFGREIHPAITDSIAINESPAIHIAKIAPSGISAGIEDRIASNDIAIRDGIREARISGIRSGINSSIAQSISAIRIGSSMAESGSSKGISTPISISGIGRPGAKIIAMGNIAIGE